MTDAHFGHSWIFSADGRFRFPPHLPVEFDPGREVAQGGKHIFQRDLLHVRTEHGGGVFGMHQHQRAGYKVDVKGRIVFIESIFCKADKVRQELTELCESNFLDGAAGIVFCHFTKGDDMDVIIPILKEFAPKFKAPVFMGFPFGHHTKNLAIDYSREVVITDGVLTFPAVKEAR